MIRNTVYIAVLALLLTACDRKESFHDLHQFLQKVDQDATSSQKSVKVNLSPEPVAMTYVKTANRSPFAEMSSLSYKESDTSLNPITRYPLNLLRFVGVISQNSQLQAYILTPDEKMFPVSVGDKIGDEDGKVVKIDPDKMEIVEQFSESGKPATQRIVTLQLKEAPSNAKN